MIKFNKKKLNTKKLALSGIFIALIIVGAYIKIPTPLVPVTLQFAFCLLAGLLLGGGNGAACVLIYILMGLVGIPVFVAGGGIFYVLQPSFGYMIGFVFGSYAAGKLIRVRSKNRIANGNMMSNESAENGNMMSIGSCDNGNVMSNGSAENGSIRSNETAGNGSIMSNGSREKGSKRHIELWVNKWNGSPKFLKIFCASLIGLALVYVFGLPYMYLIQKVYLGLTVSFSKIFIFGCAMFLPTDILWCVLASLLSAKLLPRLSPELLKSCEYQRENFDKNIDEKIDIE
ncbi:MAG: ECF transporter S component [Clostridia bacterium]